MSVPGASALCGKGSTHERKENGMMVKMMSSPVDSKRVYSFVKTIPYNNTVTRVCVLNGIVALRDV
jgi:hypothetical protein